MNPFGTASAAAFAWRQLSYSCRVLHTPCATGAHDYAPLAQPHPDDRSAAQEAKPATLWARMPGHKRGLPKQPRNVIIVSSSSSGTRNNIVPVLVAVAVVVIKKDT